MRSRAYIIEYAGAWRDLFRYVDDVDFVFDDRARQIHFRSASRVGHWDLGVNRRRMERVRGRFLK